MELKYIEIPLDFDDSDGRSPTNLVFARSHEDLRRRKDRPVEEGLSMRERLYCKDYCCTE